MEPARFHRGHLEADPGAERGRDDRALVYLELVEQIEVDIGEIARRRNRGETEEARGSRG
jgi:hypothetical protein